MNTFDTAFFNELNKLDTFVELGKYNRILMPPLDGFNLHLSQLQKAGKVDDGFVGLTRNFIDTLAMRSDGCYLFEEDFRVRLHQIYSFNKGRSGRKQLYVGFDACPHSDLFPKPWGASIGLGFDFRDKQGIVPACVNEYEAFYEKVYCDQELFDTTFGNLGGYAEPCGKFEEPIAALKVLESVPDMLQNWLFFGKRLKPNDVAALGSLESFADECICVFDAICDANYYESSQVEPFRKHEKSFENFVVGEANQLAHDAAIQVSRFTDKVFNPLFIYGGSGLGKTRLLQAIGNEFTRNNDRTKVCYIHAANFVPDVAQNYRTNQFFEYRSFYYNLDLLLIDDIQALSGKKKTQEGLLNILNWLVDTNKQVVISCDTPLNKISGIEPQLLSRLSGGLSVALNPPDLELRKAILLHESYISKKPIQDVVVDFVARLVVSNIRELEGAYHRIKAFAILYNRPITLELAQKALKDMLASE